MLEIPFKSNSQLRGTLIMNRARLRRMTRIEPASIAFTQWFKPDRERIEKLIETVYATSYNAIVASHYPNLIGVFAADGSVMAAAGFRQASAGPLFLEGYLGESVEQVIAARTGTHVPRAQIVEIGNLASSGRGASLFLFVTLAAFLQRNRFTYAVATATETLRRSFESFGFGPVELGRARAEILPDGGTSWGTYYQTNPCVLAGALASARERLEAFLPEACNAGLDDLFAVFHHSSEESFE